MRSYLLLAAVALLSGCGIVRNIQRGSNNTASTSSEEKSSDEKSSEEKSSDNSGTQIKLTLHQVMDTNGTGRLAGTYLLPDGYSAKDEIKWIPNDYLTPVLGTMVLTSEDGSVVMESMSGLQTNFGHSPAGSFGTAPPNSVCAFLLSSWKRQHSGLKYSVISKQDSSIPEAVQTGAGFKMYGNRGVVKLQYSKDGVAYTVKCSARVDVMMTIPTTTAIGGTMYEGGWLTSSAFTVTAPSEGLPNAMKLFGIVLASYHTDPHFFNTVVQARDIIQKNFYGRLGEIMETSRIISRTNDQMLASIDSQYKSSQKVADHESSSFDDYIRGVDHYQESDGEVALPSGYAHAFYGNGKYIVTDQHGYDPNVNGPGGSWTEMEKTR